MNDETLRDRLARTAFVHHPEDSSRVTEWLEVADAVLTEIGLTHVLVERKKWALVYVSAIDEHAMCELSAAEQDRADVKAVGR